MKKIIKYFAILLIFMVIYCILLSVLNYPINVPILNNAVIREISIYLLLAFFWFAFFLILYYYLMYKKIKERSIQLENINARLRDDIKKAMENLNTQKVKSAKEISDAYKSIREEKASSQTARRHEIQTLEAENTKSKDALLAQLNSVNAEKEILQQRIQVLLSFEYWHQMACKLYPEIAKEIDTTITEEIRKKNMQEAKAVEEKMAYFMNLSADKDLCQKLLPVLSAYKTLSDAAKQYVSYDIEQLNRLYEASLELKNIDWEQQKKEDMQRQREQDKKDAQKATDAITKILDLHPYAKFYDLSAYQEAKKLYDALNENARSYCEMPVIADLHQRLEQANADAKNHCKK